MAKKDKKIKKDKKNIKAAGKKKVVKKSKPAKTAHKKKVVKAAKKKVKPAKAKKVKPLVKKAKPAKKSKPVKIKKAAKPNKKAIKKSKPIVLKKIKKPAKVAKPKKEKKAIKPKKEIAPPPVELKKAEKPAKVKIPKPPKFIKAPIITTAVQRDIIIKADQKDPKGKFELEYLIHCSAPILFEFLTTPSGLSEWFCDDVNVRDGIYSFFWDGGEQKAKIIGYKEPLYVRFQWLDKAIGYYFEFKTQTDELTGDVALIVSDFAENEGEKQTSSLLWNSQVHRLMQKIGSY